MSNSSDLFLCLALTIGSVAVFIGSLVVLLYGLSVAIRGFVSCPTRYKGHFLTALIWTVVLGIYTIHLVFDPSARTLPAHLVVLVAGLAFRPAWRQLKQRRQGIIPPQKTWLLPMRLFVQTLWGPLAFWAIMTWINKLV